MDLDEIERLRDRYKADPWEAFRDDLAEALAANADSLLSLARDGERWRKHTRWNIEEGENGAIHICFGLHEKGERCEWKRFVPASAALQTKKDRPPAEADERPS